MTDRSYNVLFLCTGNSARSILAESLMNHLGRGRFRAFSAGSFPKGEVHPLSLELLRSLGLPHEDARSKSWDEFARAGAPAMDFIFTVCDQAAGEICPIWPGTPITAHWGVPDPAAVVGTPETQGKAFRDTLHILQNRIALLMSLPVAGLDRMALQSKLRDIGRQPAPTAGSPA